jgi:hypothetical protein
MPRTLLLLLMLLAPLPAISQDPRLPTAPSGPAMFQPGNLLLGPSALVGNLGGGDLAIGGELEYGLTTNQTLGRGTLGISFRAHTYSYDFEEYSGLGDASIRITPIALGVNYHFVLNNRQFDPYVGLAVGYATASYKSDFADDFSVNSGTYLMIDAGGRYYLGPRMAIQAGLSAGSRSDVGLLRIAAMFQL